MRRLSGVVDGSVARLPPRSAFEREKSILSDRSIRCLQANDHSSVENEEDK